MIDTPETLAGLVDELADENFLAVDTEFIRERTFFPQLCLVQVASDKVIACIDALALDDLSPLWNVLLNKSIRKVLHSARQDLEILWLATGAVPTPVFDTQIAAGFLGHGGQIGYASLAQSILDVTVDKSQSRTDWSQRPLSEAQLAYAANDVEHLVRLYHALKSELATRGRSDWVEPEFEALTREELYQIDPESSWKRIKGASRLNGEQLDTLQRLAAWRERRAMDRDRPRQWILKNSKLLDIARKVPETRRELASIDGIPPTIAERHGKDIVALCKRPGSKTFMPAVQSESPLTGEQKGTLSLMMQVLQTQSDEHAISPEVIVTRRELEKLVRGRRNLPVLSGWRLDLVGYSLLQLISDPAPD